MVKKTTKKKMKKPRADTVPAHRPKKGLKMPKAPKVKHKIHWTHAEDALVQKLREAGETWSAVAEKVSALGVCSRSGATCLQRSLYLDKTRQKGHIALRSLPSQGLSVTITFPGLPDTKLQTRRTLKEILAFFKAATPS